MVEQDNGQRDQPKPKRHNARPCPFAIRQRIVNALANGDSIRSIARALHVSNNTVVAIRDHDWQQVATRKARIAAQAERAATLAGDRINAKLESNEDIPINSLVPVFGVAVDKLMVLRGEPGLTVHHTHSHSHSHQVELINALREANARAEKRCHGSVVDLPALPADTRLQAEKTQRKKAS